MHVGKKMNWQGTGETQELYIHTQQVKVIRAGTDNQGGGRNYTSREGESETRREVNTPK